MKKLRFKKIVGLACLSWLAMPMNLLASKIDEKAPSCFFVQTANKAMLQSDQLTLLDPSHEVVWFADAPSVDTGVMPQLHYLNLLWGTPSSHFNLHHPNASLVGEVMSPITHQLRSVDIILTLESVTEKNHHLVYQVHPLPHQHSLIDLKNPIYLHHATLFIDKYICPTCT